MTDSPESRDQGQDRASASAIPLLITVLVWIGVAWLSHVRYSPPEIRGLDSLRSSFSAVRAEPVFERLYKDAQPHPAGQNESFRQKVIDEFERLGFPVEQHATSSPPLNSRAELDSVPLVNLIVRLEGKTDKPPVMLCAHYDSTAQGPGAADDGVGLTALIEIARMLRDEPPLDRAVIFLVTDGEEYGLLGARKFVEEHKLADEVAAVINLEARGTNGPSLMFETSNDEKWLIDLFARTSNRPFASSLFYEIYRFLPNDTDFTVFKRHGIPGFNFAFIGDVKNYHTANDNFETVDRRSLQHHGENALPLLRQLANTDIENQSVKRTVYFDIMGFFIVKWSSFISIGLAIAGLILVFWFSNWRTKQEKLDRVPAGNSSGLASNSNSNSNSNSGIAVSVLLVTVGIVSVALFGKFLDIGYRFDGAIEIPWPANPLPIQASFWSFGVTVLLALVWLFRNRLDWRATWFGVWLIWATLAICTSQLLAGASFLFIVPLLVTGVACLMAVFVGHRNSHTPVRQAAFVSIAGAVAVSLVWLPMERLFYDALGFKMGAITIARVTFALTSLLPIMVLAQRRALGLFTIVGLMVSVGLTLWAVIGN